MKRHLLLGVVTIWIGGNILINSVQYNEANPHVYAAPEEEPQEVQIKVFVNWTEERIIQEIETQAEQYGVSADIMKKVIKCESGYNPHALEDGGKSRGLSQIHSDYHSVTDEQAYDPAYAIEFLAKHLAQGKGYLWSCFRSI